MIEVYFCYENIEIMKNKKIKIALLFGGRSGEHEVSITSAHSIFKALDQQKYDVTLIGIDKGGRWSKVDQETFLEYGQKPRELSLSQIKNSQWPAAFPSDKNLLEEHTQASSQFDVVFPVLHGTYGEDGTIQGLFELSQTPYVGSGVLGSALGMDKDVSRRLMKMAGIPVVPTLVVRLHEYQQNPPHWLNKIEEEIGYPYFVKPANMGSSVGVNKVKNFQDAQKYIASAFEYDTKILIEENIAARELEIAILGNHECKASTIGEIVPTHEFYSYEAKYLDENGAHLKIPATNISPELKSKIESYALLAFQTLECRGLARVDFFLDRESGELYLNEINTMPGFTSISMYPKLWEASGIKYANLLDQLIQLAIEAHNEKANLKTSL